MQLGIRFVYYVMLLCCLSVLGVIQKLRKSTFKSFDPSFKMSSHSELAEPGVPGSIGSFKFTYRKVASINACTMVNGTLLNFGKRYEHDLRVWMH